MRRRDREAEGGDNRGAGAPRERTSGSTRLARFFVGFILFGGVGGAYMARNTLAVAGAPGQSAERRVREAGRSADAAADEVGRWRKRYGRLKAAVEPDRSRDNANGRGANANRQTPANTNANGNASRSTSGVGPCRPPGGGDGHTRPRRACAQS